MDLETGCAIITQTNSAYASYEEAFKEGIIKTLNHINHKDDR